LKDPGGGAPAFECFGLTDAGRKRAINEDQFLIADLAKTMLIRDTSLQAQESARLIGAPQGRLLLVADGMGGKGAGRLASSVAVDSVIDQLLNVVPWFYGLDQAHESDLRSALKAAMARCQSQVRVAADAERANPFLGTTLTMAYVIWPRAWVVHVGDTRCYLFRDSRLEQVSKDHNLAQRMAEREPAALPDLRRSRFRNVLWNAIGGDTDALSPEVYKLGLRPGDALLLCTDGLLKHVTDDELETELGRGAPAEDVCRRLVAVTNERGGADNVTVVLARFR
jgi:PPM family protein phosphatase